MTLWAIPLARWMGADSTAKVDVGGLQAGTADFDRFKQGTNHSPVGCNRTLPLTVDRLHLAVMPCTNSSACSLDVQAEGAKTDVKFTLHQVNGMDESPADGYASSGASHWDVFHGLPTSGAPWSTFVDTPSMRTRNSQARSQANHGRLRRVCSSLSRPTGPGVFDGFSARDWSRDQTVLTTCLGMIFANAVTTSKTAWLLICWTC